MTTLLRLINKIHEHSSPLLQALTHAVTDSGVQVHSGTANIHPLVDVIGHTELWSCTCWFCHYSDKTSWNQPKGPRFGAVERLPHVQTWFIWAQQQQELDVLTVDCNELMLLSCIAATCSLDILFYIKQCKEPGAKQPPGTLHVRCAYMNTKHIEFNHSLKGIC